VNDHEAIAKEEAAYQPIPNVAMVTEEDVLENYTCDHFTVTYMDHKRICQPGMSFLSTKKSVL
jgi:hypothetical protein